MHGEGKHPEVSSCLRVSLPTFSQRGEIWQRAVESDHPVSIKQVNAPAWNTSTWDHNERQTAATASEIRDAGELRLDDAL